MLAFFAFLGAKSQIIMVNKGDTISVVGDTEFMSVIGGVWNDSAGAWYNEGTIYITDSIKNDGTNSMFHDSWTGTVDLRGDNQVIAGEDVTWFWDLRLTNTGIKRQAINAVVEDSLILNHLELATDSFVVFCINPDPGIVTRSTGFVSSLDTGSISRNVDRDTIYLFPTGSSLVTNRYRPVEIKPNLVAPGTFTVRMANLDATLEGYDRSIKDSSLCLINPFFYHRINRTQGNSPADLDIFYDPAADGAFDAMAHWQNLPRWENMGQITMNPPGPLASIRKDAWNNFLTDPFALANFNPFVTLYASADSICYGDNLTLTADPGGYFNYTFINNGTDTIYNGPDSAFTTTLLPPGTNFIHVVAFTGVCDYTSNTVQVEVNQPFFIDAGRDTFICFAQPVTLGGTPSAWGGLPGYSYNWIPSGILNADTIPNPWAIHQVTTDYILTVEDEYGCVLIDTMTVTVNPQINIDAGPDRIICYNDSTRLGSFPATAYGGTGIIVYNWTPNYAISGTTIPHPWVQPLVTTTYYLEVTDSNACQNWDTVLVEVNPELFANAGNDTFICFADPITLGGNPTAWGGTGPYQLYWLPPNLFFDPTQPNPTLNLFSTTTFGVFIEDANHCLASDSITVTVNPQIFVDAGPDHFLCFSDSAQLGGAPTMAGGTGPLNLIWTPAAGLNSDLIPNPFALPAATTVYYVTVTDVTGCAEFDSSVVVINPELVVDAGADTLICYDELIVLGGNPTITGGAGGFNIQWIPAGILNNDQIPNPSATLTTSTTFTINVTDASGCQGSDNINVSVNPQLFIDAGADSLMCFGTTVTLGGNPTASGGTGGITFAWNPAAGLSGANLANPVATPSVTTTYTLTATDISGCFLVDSALIGVEYLQPALVTASGDLAFCDPDSVILTAPAGNQYLWNNGETTQSITVVNTGTYFVQMSQYCGIATSDTFDVTVWATPTAAFTADTTINQVTVPINFIDLSTGNIGSWTWDFGDGTGLINDQNPAHGYENPGTYTVTLVVESPIGGCTDTATMVDFITIILEAKLWIPTAFTPNGDGLNDQFGAMGSVLRSYQMDIFNRWGQLVFTTNNLDDWWDGTFQGKLAQEDAYVFKVRAVFMNGGEYERGGTVTLIR